MHIFNPIFDSLQFGKYNSYDDHPFFQNFKNLLHIPKMEQKTKKNLSILR